MKMKMNQKGFVPILIIIIASIIVASAGTGVILHKQGKLAPLVADISEVFKGGKKTVTLEPKEAGLETQELEQKADQAELEAEQLRQQAEATQEEVEKEKLIAETEKAKAEAEKARLEAEQAKAEAGKLKQELEEASEPTQEPVEGKKDIAEEATISTSTPTVTPTPTDEVGPITTSTVETETLEVTSVKVVPDVTSAQIEWQTNKPTTAKVFISGGSLSSKVYHSQSGLSTHHVADVTGLNSNTNYSYEIESITDEQVEIKYDSFVTKKGDLTINADDCTTHIGGTWCEIKVSYLENGIEVNTYPIAISSDDDNGEFVNFPTDPGICSGGEPDNYDGSQRRGNPLTCSTVVPFYYYPESIETKTITAVVNGVSATTNVQGEAKCAKENADIGSNCELFTEMTPRVEKISENKELEINSISETIGKFKFTGIPNSVIRKAYIEADVPVYIFIHETCVGSGYKPVLSLELTVGSNEFTIKNKEALSPGTYSVRITEIEARTYKTNEVEQFSNLPIVFTFEVKDIPQPEFIPIKTTHTYSGGPNPGVIGLFKIKMRPNSDIKVLCDAIQMGSSDSYSAYIYAETATGRQPQCPTSWFGGESEIKEFPTDSEGVSVFQYSLWVDSLTPPSNKMEFSIEGLRVKDGETGFVRNILNSPVFKLEIVQ